MKFSLSWLREYLPTKLSPEEIAQTLTLLGVEVEKVEALDSNDFLFEVSITPNLAHDSNLIGIARELASITHEKLQLPSYKIHEKGPPIESLIQVIVEDKEHCFRYACRIVTNAKVTASPDWLQKRMRHCGMRSINSVVDAANFVMFESGIPFHAFDYDALKGKKIIVRRANGKEQITTLDGKTHSPSTESLLICDAQVPIAIAGIMGSQDTEVTEKTKNILIEATIFDPSLIRRTRKRMDYQTEGSRLQERGVDLQALPVALDRLTALVQELTQGDVAQGTIDQCFKLFSPVILSCRVKRVNQLLGTQLALGEIETIFRRLGFEILSSQNNVIEVAIPSYRQDIRYEIDLVEEVARLYGYDNIYEKSPAARYPSSKLPHDPLYTFEHEIRALLMREGLQELLTCDLISPHQAAIIEPDCMPSRALVKLLNPCSVDQSVLRQSLLPNLLQVAKYNKDHEISSIAGFEVGKVHFKVKDHYVEPTVAAIVLMGKRAPYHWEDKPKAYDFFDLKGIVENLLEGLHLNADLIPSSYANFHPTRQARILLNGHEIGILGEVHPHTLEKVGITHPIFYAELNVQDLLHAFKKERRMTHLPQFPSSHRDWTVTIEESCPMETVFQLIKMQQSPLIEEVVLIDIYQDEKMSKKAKNVTLRFVYRNHEKTVSFDEVEKEHSRITKTVLLKLEEKKSVSK